MTKQSFSFFLCLVLLVSACKKDPSTSDSEANLHFQFKFDENQLRLNNIGQPSVIPSGHAAQSPAFRKMSVHYVELAPNALTPLGQGAILYKAAETTKGGDNAIDFDQAKTAGAGEHFLSLPLKGIPAGTYTWVRASVAYQNYDVYFNINKLPILGDVKNQKGTVASFVGFNTYISTVTPREKTLTVNDDKKQGFWAFETELTPPYNVYNQLTFGEAPAGATTVVNPLFATSPVPAGSCVVTGEFTKPLVVTGNETSDIVVTLSFSVNKSFEWIDDNANGQLDFYGDGVTPNEKIVDMGLRGLIPIWE